MNIAVYKAINAVQSDLVKEGITKDRRNSQQGYNFRGIDEVYNALSPLLAKHGLCILPRMISRHCDERQSKNGGQIFYVTVEAEFDFVATEDGSTHIVRTFGEAMDSADKATNKAMSAAYKYAAFQAFAIPTEGDNDADAHTPDPVVKKYTPPTPLPTTVKESSITDKQRKELMAMYNGVQRDERLADANFILKKAKPEMEDIKSFSDLTERMAKYLIGELGKQKAAMGE